MLDDADITLGGGQPVQDPQHKKLVQRLEGEEVLDLDRVDVVVVLPALLENLGGKNIELVEDEL